MSTWEATLLTTWSSAGGIPVADLGPVFDASEIQSELGGRGTIILELDAGIAWALTAAPDVVRVTRRDRGDYLEVRIVSRSRPTQGPEGQRFRCTALPRIYDLDLSDLVRETLGGRTITRFSQNLTLAQYVTRFFFANLAADRLTGVLVGDLPATAPAPLAWDRWSRGQLLAALLEKFRVELRWTYLPDGSEQLSFAPFVNDDAPIVPLRYGDRLASHNIEEDYQQLCTVARIVGEPAVADAERATIAENAWEVIALRTLTGGRTACEIREIGGARSPILEEGQWAGRTDTLRPDRALPARYLQRGDRVARTPILASYVDTAEVVVATSAAPSVGERISIVADAEGNPLELLELPVSVGRYGYAVRDVQVPGGRGEQQYATNGGHEDGATGWSAVNSGDFVPMLRSEFDVDFTALANGSRSAGVGTGTPLAVDGLPRRLVRGDILQQQGGQFAPTAAFIPSGTGALAFSIGGGGLPAAYADNDPITFVRRDLATFTAAVNTLRASGILVLSNADTDLVQQLAAFARTDGYFPSTVQGDVDLIGPGGEDFNNNLIRLYAWPGEPTRLVVRYAGYGGGGGTSVAGTFSVSTYTVLSAQRIRFRYGFSTGVLGTHVECEFAGTYYAANVPAWATNLSGRFGFSGLIVGSGTDGGYAYVDVDWLGVPTDASLIGLTANISSFTTGGFPCFRCYNEVWSGDFALTWQRETRTLNFDGAHIIGATALTFKPVTALARRDWQSGDTLYHRRDVVRLTLRFTAINLATQELTIDLATSTAQDYQDRWGTTVFRISGSFSIEGDLYEELDIQLSSIAGTTVTWIALAGFDDTLSSAGTPQTVLADAPASTDSYSVSSTAAWASTGLASVPITIPSGRTLRAGDRVWSNFHGDSGASMMVVATTVSGAASALSVRGGDAYPNDWAGITTPLLALWRAATDSYLEILGNTLRVASATTLTAGAQDVTLMEANANAIADNSTLRIVRPRLFGATDRLTGSALRLLCGAGGTGEPFSASAGVANALAYFRVPAGSTRTITARVVFRLSIADWYAGEAGSVAIVSEAGAVLGWSALGDDGVGIDAAEGTITIVAAAVIGASGRYGVRVFGGITGDFTRWCVHDETMFYLGEASDAPYNPGSYASQMLLTAAPYVQERCAPRISDTLTVQELSAVYAQALGIADGIVPEVVLGGRVHLEDWDRLARVLAITSRPGQPIAGIEIGQLGKDGGRMLGEATLAAGVGGIR